MPIDFQKMPHAGIQSLVPYKPGKSIAELQQEKGLSDIIKMASNENPLGCSPLALDALHHITSTTIATYPSPLHHPLMLKLSKQLDVNVNQLFLSNGSDYIYGLLINAFTLHNNKHILTHQYAFSTYAIQAHTLQVPVKTIGVDHTWRVDMDALIKACTKHTGIIFLANPNNPTGLLIPQEEIKYLLDNIPIDTLLVMDEAYHEYTTTKEQHNTIEWLSQYPNLLITRTFSKIYGMAGLRLGYAIAHPDIINILWRMQLPFVVNQTALHAAHAALDDHDFIKKSLTLNRRGMEQMSNGLKKLKLKQLPSSANFITFDCQEDGMMLYNYLLDQGIIVRPLHPYSMNNYLRVSIGTSEQNNRFLQVVASYIAKNKERKKGVEP